MRNPRILSAHEEFVRANAAAEAKSIDRTNLFHRGAKGAAGRISPLCADKKPPAGGFIVVELQFGDVICPDTHSHPVRSMFTVSARLPNSFD